MRGAGTGFTIVELLTVLAVAAVLTSIAIPALNRVNVSNRMVGEVNQLAGALRIARNEALKHGGSVEICAARGSAGGVLACNDSADWSEGWLVFPVATPGAPLAAFHGFSGNDTLHSAGGFKRLYFNRYGFSSRKDTLVLCPPSADPHQARALLLEPSGRVLLAEDNDGSGIVDDIDGNDVSCPLVN